VDYLIAPAPAEIESDLAKPAQEEKNNIIEAQVKGPVGVPELSGKSLGEDEGTVAASGEGAA